MKHCKAMFATTKGAYSDEGILEVLKKNHLSFFEVYRSEIVVKYSFADTTDRYSPSYFAHFAINEHSIVFTIETDDVQHIVMILNIIKKLKENDTQTIEVVLTNFEATLDYNCGSMETLHHAVDMLVEKYFHNVLTTQRDITSYSLGKSVITVICFPMMNVMVITSYLPMPDDITTFMPYVMKQQAIKLAIPDGIHNTYGVEISHMSRDVYNKLKVAVTGGRTDTNKDICAVNPFWQGDSTNSDSSQGDMIEWVYIEFFSDNKTLILKAIKSIEKIVDTTIQNDNNMCVFWSREIAERLEKGN